MRKLWEFKRMAIYRDPKDALMSLLARCDRERGQSLTEYVLILVLVTVAAVAVLGMVSSVVSAQLDLLASVPQGERESSAFRIPFALPSWIVIGTLLAGAVGLYVFRLRRG